MIRSDYKATLNGKRLKVEYFEGDIYIEDMDKRSAYEWLVSQANKTQQLASNILKEADKYGGQE